MTDDRERRSDPPREPGGERNEDKSGTGAGRARSVADDLTEGLGMVLNAARKAVQNVEKKKLEELGRRAFTHFDRSRVEELGRKAKKNLDPKRIEELAEDAGRELVRVVERVAERMESILGAEGTRSSDHGEDAGSAPQSNAPASKDAPAAKDTGASHDSPSSPAASERPRVRIKDD